MDTLREVEDLRQKAYIAYHQDGILDITAAAILLGFGIFMATSSVIFLILGILFATQYILMKQRITVPRFGYVRFVPKEKALTRNWFLLGLGVLIFLATILARRTVIASIDTPEFQALSLQYHMVPLSGLLFGLPMLAAAVFLYLRRFYLYALLSIGLPALGAWMDIDTFIPIVALGVVVLFSGIRLLAIFLKKYSLNGK